MSVITEPSEWRRVGRGSEVQFYATDREIQQWLINELPTDFAPFSLTCSDMVKSGRQYHEVPFDEPVDERQKPLAHIPTTVWRGSQTAFQVQTQPI